MAGSFARPLFDRLDVDPDAGLKSTDLSEAEAIASIESALTALFSTRFVGRGPGFGIPEGPSALDLERAIGMSEPRLRNARVLELDIERGTTRVVLEANLGTTSIARRLRLETP